MPSSPPPPPPYSNDPDADDGFDDDPQFVNQRFDDPSPAAPRAALADDPYGADPYRGDPYAPEPVLVEEGQNVPSSYNVRNILLLATGGFVLLLVAFLWSISGTDDPERDGQLAEQVPIQNSPGAQAPADLLGGPGAAQDDDLAALLNDPSVANGGAGTYGAYSEPAPPQTSSSYSDPTPVAASAPSEPSSGGGLSAEPAGPQEPTYYDRRRAAFFSALGLGSREAIGAQPPAGSGTYAEGGQGGFAGGDTPGGGYTSGDLYGQGGGSQGGGGQGGAAGSASGAQAGGGRAPAGGGGRRTGPPALPPASGYRQAGTSASAPFAPYTLPQGTLIPVVLETAVNSDLEGVFIARTVEDVYDRTRRHVLIPRGSQVVSSYQNAEAIGDRLQAAASRLNLPDGRSVDFSDAGVYDLQGRRGLRDQVNRHTASRVGAGALITIVGIASSVGQRRANRDVILVPNADGTVTQVPTGTDIQNEAISRGAQGAEQAVSERAQRVLNRPNTLILRPGLRGTLILQQDVDMRQPYYNDGGAVPRGPSPFDRRLPRPSSRVDGTGAAARGGQ